MYEKIRLFDINQTTKQVLINGELIEYKCMYEGDLEKAIEFTKNFAPNYLGKSKIIFINGKRQQENKVEAHFFN